jgi:hypothetical protein
LFIFTAILFISSPASRFYHLNLTGAVVSSPIINYLRSPYPYPWQVDHFNSVYLRHRILSLIVFLHYIYIYPRLAEDGKIPYGQLTCNEFVLLRADCMSFSVMSRRGYVRVLDKHVDKPRER